MASWLENIPTKYLSSIHVFLKVDQVLSQWVTNRTVLACLAVDLMITIYDTWFFFAFHSVFQLNMILKHNWLHYLITVFGVASTCFGMYCAILRKPYAARLYFGCFMLDHLFSIPSYMAIYKLKCECIRYDQCEALIAFAAPNNAPLNPFIPPQAFKVKHHIPFEEPPEKIHATTSDIVEVTTREKRVSRLQLQEGTSQLERRSSTREVEVSVRNFKGLSVRRASSHRSDNSANLLSMSVDPPTKVTGGALKAADGTLIQPMPAEVVRPEDTEKLLAEPFKAWKRKGYAPLHFFDITDENIQWTTQQKSCASYPLNSTKRAEFFAKKLSMIRLKDEQARTTNWLETRLFKCIIQHLCMAVSIDVVARASGKAELILCDLHMQATPSLWDNKAQDSSDITLHQSISFQRNEKVIQNEFDPRSTITRDKTIIDGVQILREIKTSSCVCKDRMTGCKVNQDVYGQNMFWCELPARLAQICEETGAQLYKSPGPDGFLWSDDHCRKATCRCSGLGMPMDPDSEFKLSKKVWANRMNLGSKCAKWVEGDQKPWCYVGFDSTCTDRQLTDVRLVSDHRVPRQYFSYLACEEGKDDKIAEANGKCTIIYWLTITIFTLRYVLFLPILVILFKFIQNRCGDFYEVEEEYAAIFTSSDEDEEEGNAGGGGEGPRASRRASAKKTAAGDNRRNSGCSDD